MPSSVAHSLAGITLQVLSGRRGKGRAALLASAADIDFLLGDGARRPGDRHGGATHSVSAAVAAGLFTGCLGWKRERSFGESFAEGALLYGSHLALDYLGRASDDGMQLLWPFSKRRLASGRRWFRTIRSESRRRGFWKGLFIRHNVKAVGQELLVFAPLLLLTCWIRSA